MDDYCDVTKRAPGKSLKLFTQKKPKSFPPSKRAEKMSGGKFGGATIPRGPLGGPGPNAEERAFSRSGQKFMNGYVLGAAAGGVATHQGLTRGTKEGRKFRAERKQIQTNRERLKEHVGKRGPTYKITDLGSKRAKAANLGRGLRNLAMAYPVQTYGGAVGVAGGAGAAAYGSKDARTPKGSKARRATIRRQEKKMAELGINKSHGISKLGPATVRYTDSMSRDRKTGDWKSNDSFSVARQKDSPILKRPRYSVSSYNRKAVDNPATHDIYARQNVGFAGKKGQKRIAEAVRTKKHGNLKLGEYNDYSGKKIKKNDALGGDMNGHDAFGVEIAKKDSYFTNNKPSKGKASTKRQVYSYGGGIAHPLVAGRPGHKAKALGSVVGHGVAGAVAGNVAGAAAGGLVGRKTGAAIGAQMGGAAGAIAGSVKATNSNNKKGRYRAEVKKNDGLSAFGVEH